MAEFATLPGAYSTFSKATVAALLTGFMNIAYIARSCDIPESTLRSHIKALEKAEEEAATKPNPKKRKRVEPEEPVQEDPVATIKQQTFLNWALLNAPVKSGTTNQRYLKRGSFVDAHYDFSAYCATAGAECVVLSTFISYCRRDRIKRLGWDRYLCDTCCDAKTADSRGEEMTPEQKAHLALISLQWEEWKSDVTSVLDDTTKIVAVHDFATIHESAGYKVRILSICLYYRDDGEVVRDFYDFVSNHKGNFQFVRHAWKELTKMFAHWRRFKTLIVWSDNGLKSKENLYYFNKWSHAANPTLEFELKFWAPNHGHSDCDRHFGQLKLSIRRRFAGTYIPKNEDAIEAIVDIANELPITAATAQMDVDHPAGEMSPFAGIRKFFYFIKTDDCEYHARHDCKSTTGRDITLKMKK